MNNIGRLIVATLVAYAFLISTPLHAEPVLKVGIQEAGAPLSFMDHRSNAASGLCVDLISAIAKDAGFQVQFEPMAFGALLSALTSSTIDIIAGSISPTPERKALVDFSETYYTYGEALAVPITDGKDYRSAAELKGITVGTVAGSIYVAMLQNVGATIKLYDGGGNMFRAVNDGTIQAGIGGAPSAAYLTREPSYPNVRLVKTFKPSSWATIAFAVRKNDGELLKKINASLVKFQAGGTLQKLRQKWGLEPGVPEAN